MRKKGLTPRKSIKSRKKFIIHRVQGDLYISLRRIRSYFENWNAGVRGVKLYGLTSSVWYIPFPDAAISHFSTNEPSVVS